MYHGHSKGREDGRSRGHIGRSPPRRRRSRSPEGVNKFCMYCKVQISSQRLYDEHCSSAVHKQKEIIIAKALSDGLQYCYTCEKIFPSKLALDAHCLMTRHKPLYRVDELQPVANQSVNMSNLIQVVTPLNDTDSRRAREDKEREDIVMKLKEVRGNEETDNSVEGSKDLPVNSDRRVEVKSHFCEVCNVDCLSNSNYKIHTESWRHRSEVDKKRDDKMKKVEARKKFDEEAEKTFDAAEEAERKKVPDNITGKAGYFCEVCSIASANEIHYLEHLKTRKHFRQVGQMRRPYKCYFCESEFNVAKDFNYHLESQPHMDKAFKRVIEEKSKKPDKDEEWVEKKTDRREGRNKDDNRDGRKEDHSSRKDDHSRRHSDRKGHNESRSKDGKKDIRKAEIKEKSPKSADCRKVEIIDSPVADTTGIKDLREKLKAQKIIITKENSPPEKPAEEEKATDEESLAFQDNPGDAEKLEQFEQEFETKFKELIKECDNNKDALQERLAKDREEDINIYQKYEEDFKEFQEVEDFNRNNIEKLQDGDPCKEDFIIDIIRVQRKMEDLRQQMEVKEMMIIKREILYRKYFPEKGEEKEAAQAETSVEVKKKPVVYDYHHGQANEEAKDKVSVAEGDKSNNASESGTTDLRIKLERERLLKRLGPELEAVDPALREKLLSVIMEKDQITDNSVKSLKDPSSVKSSKDSKTGDTRQVLKDNHHHFRQTQMDILTKREKQLEIELAKLKSNAMASVNKKKPVPPKSLVPQYDDVDDKKKKDSKKRPRNRSISISSVSSSSSSSSDKVEKKLKKKRKKSPAKARVKSKTGSGSGEKNRRKRRSASKEREKKKKIATKRVKDDDKKKKTDRLKTEKKKVVKLTVKSREKGSKVVKDVNNPLAEDNDSDVQEVVPKPVQTISVIGSAAPLNIPSPQVTTTTVTAPSTSTSTASARRKEQFSCWKSSSQPRLSPKEDIWDSAFSGGQEEDTAVSSTINLFDPSSGTAQLPEDILNILKSVAPIIQQCNQKSSPLKDNSMPSLAINSSESYTQSNSLRNRDSVDEDVPESTNEEEEETFNNDNPINQVEETTTRIRSILKKVNNHLPTFQNVHRDSPIASQPSSEIPDLIPSLAPSSTTSTLDYSSPSATTSRRPEKIPTPPVTSRRPDNVGRSILKQRSSYGDSKLTDSDKLLYEKSYSSTDRSPPRYTDQKEDYIQNKHVRDTRDSNDSNGKPFSNVENQRNSDADTRMRNKEWQDTNTMRKDIAPGNSRPYNESQHPDNNETQRHMYRDDPMEYKMHDSSHQDIYGDKFRQGNIPTERDRSDHIPSSRLDGASPRNIPPSGRLGTENPGSYNSERNPRLREQPFVRSEVTHRVIDYSYVRDTRIIPEEKTATSAQYNDDALKQPVRYPGETDDEYYARFERFYEMTRRKESTVRGERGEFPHKTLDDPRVNPDTRQPPPPREDLYRPSDRKLERFNDHLPSRLPSVDDYPPQRSLASHDRKPPMGRVESVRRVEDVPVPIQDERDRYLPYRRAEIVEKRYTTETSRNFIDDYVPDYRDHYPGRDNRNFAQDPLKPLPPAQHLPQSPHRLPSATHELPPRQPPSQSMKLGDFQDY